MVDRITALERGHSASAIKNVTMSEDFFAHHFPQHPIMPGALIVEGLVQLADWLIRENEDFQSAGLPTAFETIKFYRLVRPGDQLRLKVDILDRQDRQYRVNGQAICEDQVAAVARFSMSCVDAVELERVDDARRFFRLISRTQ